MLDTEENGELPESGVRDLGKKQRAAGSEQAREGAAHADYRRMGIRSGGGLCGANRLYGWREDCPEQRGAQNLDASGCYVLPLLIDLHIHGYAGADVGSAEPAELERMAGRC